MTDSTTAKVYSYDAQGDQWTEAINAMRSGQVFECDESFFDYFLEVLPPVHMHYTATLPDGTKQKAAFGFAEGMEEVVAFWSRKDGDRVRHFGCRTNEINPRG